MRVLWAVSTAVSMTAAALFPRSAQAQETGEVSPTGKGITGGALLGGEVVMLVEAALSVKPAWAYIAGGLAGAIGGGVGGYYAEQEATPKLSLYLLAGGMALAIPTTVAVLSASAYEVPADYTQDQAPTDEPVAEPPQPKTAPSSGGAPSGVAPGSTQQPAPSPTPAPPSAAPPAALPAAPASPPPQSRAPSRPRIGQAGVAVRRPSRLPALVGWGRGTLTLSVPAVEVENAFTPKERAEFGVKPTAVVRVPVFRAHF